jgi:hypothetical protein
MWWPGTELNRRRQPFQGCIQSPYPIEEPRFPFSDPVKYWTQNGRNPREPGGSPQTPANAPETSVSADANQGASYDPQHVFEAKSNLLWSRFARPSYSVVIVKRWILTGTGAASSVGFIPGGGMTSCLTNVTLTSRPFHSLSDFNLLMIFVMS